MKNITMLSSLDKSGKDKVISELHDFYIPYRKNLELPKHSTFGCEIEFKIANYCCPSYSDEYDYIHDFMDSIGYNYFWEVVPERGVHLEIISPVLKDTSTDWKTLEDILNFLIIKGAFYSGRCGAHVHVGKQVLGTDINALINLLKLWMIYEEVIIKFTNGVNYYERKNFNVASSRAAFVIEKFLNDLNANANITMFPNSLYSKMLSINLGIDDIYDFLQKVERINKKKVSNTVEFRSANGTLNKVIWQNLINFYVKMMHSCGSSNFDIELLNYRQTKGIEPNYYDDMAFELCDLVFDNDFDKHCFLRQYYKDFDEPNIKNPFLESKAFWK